MSKVFGIGFHKTGTKSLGVALSLLGFRTTHQFGTRDPDISENALPRALEISKHFDAFQDNPWPILYKQLDEAYPGSKFILTICPEDEWIRRVVRYFGHEETPMRKWIYGAGSPVGNEQAYLSRYRTHNDEVQDHFKGRDDLLVFPLTTAPAWRPLCDFLGVPSPETSFPHVNKGAGTRA